jgi:hypothetical protein
MGATGISFFPAHNLGNRLEAPGRNPLLAASNSPQRQRPGNVGHLYMCGSSGTSAPSIQRIGFNNTATTSAKGWQHDEGGGRRVAGGRDHQRGMRSSDGVLQRKCALRFAGSDFLWRQHAGQGKQLRKSKLRHFRQCDGNAGNVDHLSSIQELNGPSGIVVGNNANTATGNFPQRRASISQDRETAQSAFHVAHPQWWA